MALEPLRWTSGLALLGLMGCRTPAEDSGIAQPSADPSGAVLLANANNYNYTGALDAPSFALAELTSVTLQWSDLRTDLQCHTLDPIVDIDNTALLGFPYLSETEVEQGLSDDSLAQVDLGVYLSYEPGDTTSVSLDQFTFFGTEANIKDEFYEGHGTWLALLTTGTGVAVGTRMLAFLTPTAGDAPTSAALEDGCPVLDFSADLTSLVKTPVLKDGPWLLDWSGLTLNGKGGGFEPTRVDSLMVARYDIPISELQANFLDIETLAAESWTYALTGGSSVDLGALEGPSLPFPGFDAESVWVLALRCGSCPNPAPLFLTVLAP